MGAEGVPINEAVALLDKISEGDAILYRTKYPTLSEYLRGGILAGGEEDLSQDPFLVDKANFILDVLVSAKDRCDVSLVYAAQRIKRARKIRFVGQVLSVVGTSTVLGSLAAKIDSLAVASGIVALLSSLSATFSDYLESISKAGDNIYVAYDALNKARFEMTEIEAEIRMLLSHKIQGKSLIDATLRANVVCRSVMTLAGQLLVSFSKQASESRRGGLNVTTAPSLS